MVEETTPKRDALNPFLPCRIPYLAPIIDAKNVEKERSRGLKKP